MGKNSNRVLNAALALFLLAAIPLLFTPELRQYQHRLVPLIWNLGHILLFFTLVWLCLNLFPKTLPQRFWLLFTSTNLAVLLLGFGIEQYQSTLGREASFEDMFRNCLGSSLALLLHPKIKRLANKTLRLTRLLITSLILYSLYPLATHTINLVYTASRFPVLADFEAPFENGRWLGKDYEFKQEATGNHVLQKTFQTGKYSTLSFFHFAQDWARYDCLRFSLGNPGSLPLRLNLRINDRQHNANNRAYHDRFNHIMDANPGWQRLAIPLGLLKEAPRSREMDLERMHEITFFTTNLMQESTLIFDDLELTDTNRECKSEPGRRD